MGGRRRIAAIALSSALVAGGTGAAIAGVAGSDGGKAEQAVLEDAAERLDVTPEKLRAALAAARDARIDEAVKAGRLTRERGDAIKAARQRSGRVLGGMRGGMHRKRFGRPPGLGMRHGLLEDIAGALGTTPPKLFESLRSGETPADIAKANGKSPGEVRDAVEAALKRRLDKAVADGHLTQKQAAAMLARADRAIEAIEAGKALRLRRHGGPGG